MWVKAAPERKASHTATVVGSPREAERLLQDLDRHGDAVEVGAADDVLRGMHVAIRRHDDRLVVFDLVVFVDARALGPLAPDEIGRPVSRWASVRVFLPRRRRVGRRGGYGPS